MTHIHTKFDFLWHGGGGSVWGLSPPPPLCETLTTHKYDTLEYCVIRIPLVYLELSIEAYSTMYLELRIVHMYTYTSVEYNLGLI